MTRPAQSRGHTPDLPPPVRPEADGLGESIADTPGAVRVPTVHVRSYATAVVAAWTLLVLASGGWQALGTKRQVLTAARLQAARALDDDLLYRRWNAMHGGVYAEVTESNPPNPYPDVAERDVITLSGRRLTLINPAYMTRQVHELARQADGIEGRSTSLRSIRPQNAPDEWQRRALESLAAGDPEVWSVEKMGGDAYLRPMRPLTTEEACLRCHAKQGYKEGDLRGGLSESVPLAPLAAAARRQILALRVGHLALWLIGLAGVVGGASLLAREEPARRTAVGTIRRLAYHDATTGLPNRALLADRLAVALAQARRNGSKVALMVIDLDHFKEVNDSRGHQAGDRLLREVGDRLRGALREGDTVARHGGDEFVALVPGLKGNRLASVIADRMALAFSEQFDVGVDSITVTASIGVAVFPDDGGEGRVPAEVGRRRDVPRQGGRPQLRADLARGRGHPRGWTAGPDIPRTSGPGTEGVMFAMTVLTEGTDAARRRRPGFVLPGRRGRLFDPTQDEKRPCWPTNATERAPTGAVSTRGTSPGIGAMQ